MAFSSLVPWARRRRQGKGGRGGGGVEEDGAVEMEGRSLTIKTSGAF